MTKRVAWFTGEPSVKDCFTPHKVYEVVREENTNFSVIKDKGVQNFCLKKGCAHICYKDWVFADVVEEVEEATTEIVEQTDTKPKKWGEWIENTTGKCPGGLKRKQKIKLKWSDGDKFNISRPHDGAWYVDKGGVNITHYKVKLDKQAKLKDVASDTPKAQEKLKSKWTKNTGVCPVDGNVKVEFKRRDGEKVTSLSKDCDWVLSGAYWNIIKWRLVD